VAVCAKMDRSVVVSTCYNDLLILGPRTKLVRRREFIALVGSATVALPFSASAQQGERVRRIGVLMGFAESDPGGGVSRCARETELGGRQQSSN
jgi:hypothetical protein